MIVQLFKKRTNLSVERSYTAPVEAVWKAWTQCDARLSYDARSWTEGEEQTTTIHHVNDLTLSEDDGTTTLRLHVSITQIGSGAKLAAFGMKWGYKQQLDHREELLARRS